MWSGPLFPLSLSPLSLSFSKIILPVSLVVFVLLSLSNWTNLDLTRKSTKTTRRWQTHWLTALEPSTQSYLKRTVATHHCDPQRVTRRLHLIAPRIAEQRLPHSSNRSRKTSAAQLGQSGAMEPDNMFACRLGNTWIVLSLQFPPECWRHHVDPKVRPRLQRKFSRGQLASRVGRLVRNTQHSDKVTGSY